MIANANKFDADYARPCFGHPHDPRTPEADGGGEVEAIEDAIKDLLVWVHLAQGSISRNDVKQALQRLDEARLVIERITGDAS